MYAQLAWEDKESVTFLSIPSKEHARDPFSSSYSTQIAEQAPLSTFTTSESVQVQVRMIVSICEFVYYAHGACTPTTFPMLLSSFPETHHGANKKVGHRVSKSFI